jgi:hypothetical protein
MEEVREPSCISQAVLLSHQDEPPHKEMGTVTRFQGAIDLVAHLRRLGYGMVERSYHFPGF